jgi:predicted RNA methylase
MSFYRFIACEYDLPTLYRPKLHKADGTKFNVFQFEDDFDYLEITPEILYSDVSYYTKLPNIYDLNFRYTEDRCERLYEYLINSCKRSKKCEIWFICLVNSKNKKLFYEIFLKS